MRDRACARDSQYHLNDTRQHDGDQKPFEGSELGDQCRNDRRQTGCGPGDAGVRAAQRPDDETADDTGQNTRKQRRIRREGYAETERQSDEKYYESGREVGGDGTL